jgi:hypothetical protein
MSDEAQPENLVAEAEKPVDDVPRDDKPILSPSPQRPQAPIPDSVMAAQLLEIAHRTSSFPSPYSPDPALTMATIERLMDTKISSIVDMIQKIAVPQAPAPTVQSTALSIAPKNIKPPAAIQGREWLMSKMNDVVLGMKDKPKPFSALGDDSKRMRIVAQGSSGRNGSSHYSIRMLKSDEPDDVEYATKSNSFPCSHYYADCLLDIPTSRAKSERLGTSGYYELTTMLSGVESPKAKEIVAADKYFASCINGDGELRHAVWEGHESAYSLSVRVFEYLIKRDDARSSKSKKEQGIELLLLSENGDRGSEAISLLASDPLYLNFTGPARLVFTPSVVTHVQIHKKVVYRCSTIVLGQSRSRIKAGVSTDVPSTKGDSKELDEILGVIRDMMSSGVRAKDIVGILRNSTGKKNAEVVAHKQSLKKVAPKVQEHQSSSEDHSSDDEEDVVYEDDAEEDQQSEEDEDLEIHRKSKPKVTAAVKKGNLQRTIDPPGAAPSKEATKVKAKYPLKR